MAFNIPTATSSSEFPPLGTYYVTISGVTTTTVAEGQDASASYDTDTKILTLNIPRGNTGSTGATGATGLSGTDANYIWATTATAGDTPSNAIGIVNDFAINSDGRVYHKTGSGWQLHISMATALSSDLALKLDKAANLSDVADLPTTLTNLGLNNVDNTSDANKPVSTAQQTALDLKYDIAGGDITGDVSVATNKFTIASASGNTTIAGTLGLTGSFAINTNKFTVNATTGDTVVDGSLTVNGSITNTKLNKFDVSAISSAVFNADGTITITTV